jgi:ribosomal protein L10
MDILTGPNSFLFTNADDEGSMKELANAIKANESLRFKGGYIEGE